MQKPKQGTQNKETPYSKEQETQHETQKPVNKKLRQVKDQKCKLHGRGVGRL